MSTPPGTIDPPETQALNTALNLKTPTEPGKAPKTRMPSAQKARAVVTVLIDANKERNRKMAMIKGMFDGNPPYSPSKLRTQAQAWRTNVPTMKGKAMRSAACVPYYDLFSAAQYYIELELNVENQVERTDKSRIVMEELDFMLKQCSDWDDSAQEVITDFVGYGKGFFMFDDYCWLPKQMGQDMVLFPDGVKARRDALQLFIIRERCTVTDLWLKIIDRDTAKEGGWNVEACIDAINAAWPYEPNTTFLDYTTLQQQLNDSQLYYASKEPTVQMSHVFVKEFSGKWSHFVVFEDTQPIANDSIKQTFDNRAPEYLNNYLCAKIEVFDCLERFFGPMVFERNDQTWNGLGALGKDTYPIVSLGDRIFCAQNDNVFMRTSLVLQCKTAAARQKVGLVQLGPTTIIPEDFEVQNSQIFGDIESALVARRDMDNILQVNTGIYQPQMEKAVGNPKTATQYEREFQQSTVLQNSGVTRFYNQLDFVYREMFRRLAEFEYSKKDEDRYEYARLANEFIERCKDRGITRAELKEVRFVRAMRASGNGSAFQRNQSLMGLLNIAGMYPERGRYAWLQDVTAAFGGFSKVERYAPTEELLNKPTDQQAWAQMENGNLKQGLPVILTDSQDDVAHAQEHLQAATQSIQFAAQSLAANENGQPSDLSAVADAVAYVQRLGGHIGQHLMRLEGDKSKKAAYNAIKEQLQNLGRITDSVQAKLQQQIQIDQENRSKMQRAQSIQQGMDPEMQLKAAKDSANLQIKQGKAIADQQLSAQRQQFDQTLADQRTAAEIGRSTAEASHRMSLERIQTEHNMAMERLKAENSERNGDGE